MITAECASSLTLSFMPPFWTAGLSGRNSLLILDLCFVIVITSLIRTVHCSGADNKDIVLGERTSSDYNDLVDPYLPDFFGVDRSIIGRASDDVQALSNNAPHQSNIDPGEAQFWRLPKSALGPASPAPTGLPSTFEECPDQGSNQNAYKSELRKREGQPMVFITVNTCDQPSPRSLTAKGSAPQ